ncbi:MAG: glycosyltransferase family 4 protein [Paraclostridium sordellii]
MKKKIVFLVANIYKCGGVQRVVSTLSNKLINFNEFDITILSIFKTNENPFFQLNKEIEVYNLYEDPFDVRFNYFKIVKRMKRFISSKQVDIFIDCGIGLTPISYLALKNKKIKKISWEHQNFFSCKRWGFEWIGKRIACKKSDCVVVITKQDLRDYIANMTTINRIEQIYNPIYNKQKSEEYNPDTNKIISCGSLVHVKGFDMLVDVAKLVFEKNPNWEWHIWGDGPDKDKLQEKINSSGIKNNLILCGYSSNLDEIYKEYSLYVMTSRREGFGMVLVEAQTNKIPIVSFNCKTGPSEIVENNVNGYLINCFDVNDMAKKINEIIENREKRIDFSNKSKINVEKFNINSIVDRWALLLKTL